MCARQLHVFGANVSMLAVMKAFLVLQGPPVLARQYERSYFLQLTKYKKPNSRHTW